MWNRDALEPWLPVVLAHIVHTCVSSAKSTKSPGLSLQLSWCVWDEPSHTEGLQLSSLQGTVGTGQDEQCHKPILLPGTESCLRALKISTQILEQFSFKWCLGSSLCTGFEFATCFPLDCIFFLFVMTALLFYCEIPFLSGIAATLLSWICAWCDGFFSFFHMTNSCLTTFTLKNAASPLHFSKHYSVSPGWCFFTKSVEVSSTPPTSSAVWPVMSPPFCCHLGQFLFTILINGYMHLLLQLLAFSHLVQPVQFPLPQGLGAWLRSSLGLSLC